MLAILLYWYNKPRKIKNAIIKLHIFGLSLFAILLHIFKMEPTAGCFTFRFRINHLKVRNSHKVFVSFHNFSVRLENLPGAHACGVLGVVINTWDHAQGKLSVANVTIGLSWGLLYLIYVCFNSTDM